MTNGEKIQTILDIDKDCTEVYGKNGMMTFSVPQEWWNAEYKEPTTETEHWVNIKNCIDGKCDDCNVCNTPDAKNDLGVDCVSRQEVDRLARIYLKEPTDNHVAFYEDFLELPPVTPQEPKIGHWIRITNGAMKEKYICSECGRQVENDGIESLLPIKYPYCHCGAKMVESQESEDKK